MIFERIEAITGAGVFEDYKKASALPDFSRYNLLYGFNGSGKTTLSRIFEALSQSRAGPNLPPGTTCSVKLTDGLKGEIATLPKEFAKRIHVFNEDFVELNLSWQAGTARPLLYIGQGQVELGAELDALESSREGLDAASVAATKLAKSVEKAFTTLKTNEARNIADQIYNGRGYDARSLVSDFVKMDTVPDQVTDPEERGRLRELIGADAPLPRLSNLGEFPDLAGLYDRVHRPLSASVGAIAMRALIEHPEMARWLRDGAKYHSANGLSECLFCDNGIAPERLEKLESLIDDRWAKLDAELDLAISEIEQLIPWLRDPAELPNELQLAPDLRGDFQRTRAAFKDQAAILETRFSDWLQALLAKSGDATASVQLDWRAAEFAAEVDALSDAWVKFGLLIAAHNEAFDRFNERKTAAVLRLKGHYLAACRNDYLKLETDAQRSRAGAEKAGVALSTADARIGEIRGLMHQHSLACPPLNSLIQSYLGHGNLQVHASDIGYEIRRNGQVVQGNLSEGEKTAIALCYFLCALNADGGKVEDSIVVIDDPISSLDTKALNYAFSLIRRALLPSAQLFILTHNVHFMNEVKKWFKSREAAQVERGRPVDVAFFVVDCSLDTESKRISAILQMSKLLKRFDSEYHYLFSIIFNINENEEDNSHIYLVPNVLRKLLETFLAFKVPNSSSFGSKLDEAIKKIPEADVVRIKALDRLVQVESHGDSLEDLTNLPHISIEESRRAVSAGLFLMESLDQAHYAAMVRQCR